MWQKYYVEIQVSRQKAVGKNILHSLPSLKLSPSLRLLNLKLRKAQKFNWPFLSYRFILIYMKEKRCSHYENANKPQSSLKGMAGTDLERHYFPWLWKDAESTKRATKTRDRIQDKKKSLFPIATVKTQDFPGQELKILYDNIEQNCNYSINLWNHHACRFWQNRSSIKMIF